MSNPSPDYILNIKKLWNYLFGNPELGTLYKCKGKNLILKGYCDSDWGSDLDKRKSTSGYVFLLSNTDINIEDYNNKNLVQPIIPINNNIISWCSTLQKIIALSSCEAEYISLKEAIKEAIYLNNVFRYLNKNLKLKYINTTPLLLIDNKGAK
jgi:hypothetical protein